MKLRDLLRHLEKHGCENFEKAATIRVYVKRANQKSTAIPRHREVNEFLANKIGKDLEVPKPKSLWSIIKEIFSDHKQDMVVSYD